MTVSLTLGETPTKLVYKGTGPGLGYVLTILKTNDGSLDVREVIPAALIVTGQTWQTMRADLATKVNP